MPTIYTNYTARDYTAIYEWLLTILREECPEYTDLNHSDAGIALIRLIARVSDSLSLYLDMAFSEAFVTSAKFKQSLIDIARTVDLLPKLPNAATAVVRITRKNSALGNVLTEGSPTGQIFIPKYTQLYTYDYTSYLLAEDVTMLPSEAYKDVSVIQGVHEILTLSKSNFYLDPKTGRYLYNLGKNISDGYTNFVENDVVIWEEVDSFWRSTATSNNFILEPYADNYNGIADTIFLVIGNGSQGSSLSNSSLYSLDMIRCDGAEGNVAIGNINIIDTVYSSFVTVSNITAATGGSGIESIEDFRVRIPKVVRTQRRAVTGEDYEALILGVPGIKRVQAIDRNDNNILPWEYVGIYVVPEGGGVVSTEVYNKVIEVCEENGALGGWSGRYIISNATYDPIDITCNIGVTYGTSSDAVISLVTAAINLFFHVDNNDISKVFVIGDLHRSIMSVAGVSWVEFPDVDYTYNPGFGHMVVAGTVTVTSSS